MIRLRFLKGCYQYNQEDCGIASLATILNYYGLSTSVSKLKSDIDFYKSGVSVQDIIDTAYKFGFESEAYQATYEELLEAILHKEVALPLILHLVEKNNGHFIVLKKATKNKIKIFDPNKGHSSVKVKDFLKTWTGVLISFSPPKIKLFKRESIFSSRYVQIILSNRKKIIYYVILSLFATSISLAGTLLYRFIIDDYILSNINSDVTFRNIIYIFILLGLFYVFQIIILGIRDLGINKISRSISDKLSEYFVSHLLNIPENKINKFNSGEILARFESIVQVQETSINIIFTLLTELLGVVCGGVLLYYLDYRLFMIALVVAFLYGVGFYIILPYLKKLRREYYTNYSENLTQVRQVLSGKPIINQHNQDFWAVQKVVSKVKESNKKLYNIAIINSLSSLVISFLEIIGTLSIFGYGTYLILSQQLSLGTLISFLSIVTIFISPIQRLILLQSDIQNINILFKRLNDVFDIKAAPNLLSETKKELIKTDYTISLKDISYKVARNPIISKLDLTVNVGEKVLLVGANGSGKTTLLKIISTAYMPTKGNIRLGNMDYNDIKISFIRECIEYVGQSPYIFEGTMLDNVLLGKIFSNDKQKQFWELYDIFELNTFPVEDILNLEIMEDGNNLSSGQKQKIALIRALLKSPKVLLLDEALSNIDDSCKQKIIKYLNSLESVTMIIISHDKSINPIVDTCYCLDKGQLRKISSLGV